MKNTETILVGLKSDVNYIKKAVDEGFTAVHKRQDIANGRLLDHDKKIVELDQKLIGISKNFVKKEDCAKLNLSGKLNMSNKDSELKSKVLWYLIGAAGTVAVALIIHYITKN